QEEAGPPGTERTQPPTTSGKASSSSSSDDGAGDEEDEYEPPACQLRSASRPMKSKEASVVLIQANREVTNSQGLRVRIPLHLVVTMRSGTLQ
ncbi:hypothetical protein CRENBAI_006031, partial [Crenichthys baileyi]